MVRVLVVSHLKVLGVDVGHAADVGDAGGDGFDEGVFRTSIRGAPGLRFFVRAIPRLGQRKLQYFSCYSSTRDPCVTCNSLVYRGARAGSADDGRELAVRKPLPRVHALREALRPAEAPR